MRDRPALDLRMLAPLSVGASAIAIIAVLVASGALSGGDSADPASGGQGDDRRSDPTAGGRTPREGAGGPAIYTVKAGDTLGSIAEDTGVSVESLRELNPQLDPQTITTGQRINLRE
jgi:LysM repeat protein